MDEIRILNRVLRLTPEGLLYESDPRHAEMRLRILDIKNSVGTPGDKAHQIEQDAILNADPDIPKLQQHDEPDDEPIPATNHVRLRHVFFQDAPDMF